METQPEDLTQDLTVEIKRLQRCINDLVSVLALPALWSGGSPFQIARTLLDVLLGMLDLDLTYVHLEDPTREIPLQMVRVAQHQGALGEAEEIGAGLRQRLGPDPQQWPPLARASIGGQEMSIVPMRMGFGGDIGMIVVGSRRPDFPSQTERLVLDVAANQGAIGLQEARRLGEQKRLADSLDQRVAQRTRELAAANDELKREIVERKRAERKSRRSEAFLAEAQHLSRIGSFSWRIATGEITWSAELYRIFEIDPAISLTLELITTRVHPDDIPMMNEMTQRAQREVSDFEYQHRLLMPNKSVKYLHLIAHGMRDAEDQLEYIGAVQDVTQRRLAEEALGKARAELARVAQVSSLGVMTASIAHEVNQPLAGIVTNASTCLRMLAADPSNVDGARETARRTIRDANRASDVITRLRALFVKKDAIAEWVDLNDATREVIALSMDELQRNRVILRSEFAADLPLIRGDRVQLQQVIMNLIRNAADAMSAVDDRPRQLVIRTARDDEDRARLSVRDSGIGFDPVGANKLFEAFYSTKSGGMGIGLSLSRSIIEKHLGRLWAVPNDGPGATFSFSIPRRPEEVPDIVSAHRMPQATKAQKIARIP